MAASAAARRYARALFQLAREAGSVAETRGELGAFSDLLAESAELSDALLRPLHPVAQRRNVLRAVGERLGAKPVVIHFFSFLIERRRIVDFPTIRGEFERLADEAEGRTRARITSAGPLTDAQRERLSQALAASHGGGQVELEETVDPSLIGGVVAQVGGLVFDGSLRTQLRQLHANLTKGH